MIIGGNPHQSEPSAHYEIENGYEEEPNFDDDPDFVDDVTEEGKLLTLLNIVLDPRGLPVSFLIELLGDILKSKPKEFDGLENIIVVDRIPQVGPERFDKLKQVLTKLFSKAGEIVSDNYPKDENGNTAG